MMLVVLLGSPSSLARAAKMRPSIFFSSDSNSGFGNFNFSQEVSVACRSPKIVASSLPIRVLLSNYATKNNHECKVLYIKKDDPEGVVLFSVAGSSRQLFFLVRLLLLRQGFLF